MSVSFWSSFQEETETQALLMREKTHHRRLNVTHDERIFATQCCRISKCDGVFELLWWLSSGCCEV